MREDSVAKNVVLTLLTCGLWSLVWQKRQIESVNDLLGREEFSFWKWLVLSLITCGIYHIYHEYLMGRAIVQAQKRHGAEIVSESLPATSLFLALLSGGIITDAIQQKEINELIKHVQKKRWR